MIQHKDRLNNCYLMGVSIVVAAVLLFVYSKNSLFYAMNDYEDVNIFLSVTDALFHGKVLYRDIFEHKGPFLYFLYSIIHILGNSYFTLWIWECISVALFVFFGIKTISLYDEKAAHPLSSRTFLYAICLAFCVCTSTSFISGGTPEELFLWMSSYALYVTLRCLKCNQYYTSKELVILGLLCGSMFWTKYALLGLYSGLALYIIYWNLAQKSIARLGKTIGYFLIGFAITCIPTIIYCTCTHSFGDMIDVYFIANIFGDHVHFGYTGRFTLIYMLIYKNIAIFLLIFYGLIYTILKERFSIKLACICMLTTTFLATCCLPVCWTYYPIPLFVFIPFGMIAWREMRNKPLMLATVYLFHFCGLIDYGGSVATIFLMILGILYITYTERDNQFIAGVCMFAMVFLSSYCLPVYGISFPFLLFIITFLGVVAWRKTHNRPYMLACLLVTTLLFILSHYSNLSSHHSDSYTFIMYGSIVSIDVFVKVFGKAALTYMFLSMALKDDFLINIKYPKILLCAGSLVLCVLAFPYIREPNYYTVQPSPQMRFAKIISQVPDANILIYKGYDFGFYKSSHTYPQVKYFCYLDLTYNKQFEQLSYIKNEIVDFIITTTQPNDMLEDVRDTSYQLIDTSEPFFINGSSRVFYLYGKQK